MCAAILHVQFKGEICLDVFPKGLTTDVTEQVVSDMQRETVNLRSITF